MVGIDANGAAWYVGSCNSMLLVVRWWWVLAHQPSWNHRLSVEGLRLTLAVFFPLPPPRMLAVVPRWRQLARPTCIERGVGAAAD